MFTGSVDMATTGDGWFTPFIPFGSDNYQDALFYIRSESFHPLFWAAGKRGDFPYGRVKD